MQERSKFDPKRITNLHQHGCFSALDGLSRYEDIVKLAVERGQSAAAITEHGNISGIVDFYRRCKEAGIKPILGQEFYICPEERRFTDRDPEIDRRRHHITILAKNKEGYKNLCKLSSIAKIEGDYYKPRIDLPTLFKYKEGLVVMSGCAVSQLNFYVESYLGNNDNPDPNGLEKARNYLKKMKEELGEDFYVEQVWLRPTGLDNPYDKKKAEEAGKKYLSIIDRQNLMNEQTTILAKELGIKRVMTGDAHYAYPKDKESHETLLCIGTASDKDDPSRLTFVDQDLSIPSAEAMYNRAKELNDFELVESQGEIIDKVDLELTLGEYHVPKFPIPEGIIMEGKEITTESQYLRYLTFKGYKEKHYEEKWKHKKAEVIAEIKKELEVIDKMGFNGYFLIVQEYVNWARANGVLVGPGRGSAAGSVVVYLIGITSIDPMEYPDLMIFERFLNPDRYSMPDIDMDFSDRQKVEDHLVELYGRENVCAIQTVSRMRAKQAFKDVARTEKYDYVESNKVAALIPDLAGEAAKTNRLANEIVENKDLRSEISQHPELKSIFDTAITLEGTVRGFGVHAAGVIISDKPLNEYVGTYLSKDNRIVQQSDSTDVESAYGLLKMDLLGLQNLSIMDECIQSVKKNYGVDLGIPDDFPLDDKATYDMIGRGESKFTFQFNSVLMRNSAVRLYPRSIKDLALLVAVVRPGPLQFLEEIIAGKNGKRFTGKKRKVIDGKEVEYYPIETTEPKIKAIVDPTYGHVVYQEQLMNICTNCCGFTMGEADKVRKAMGKSKPSELAKYRPHFIQGFLENTDSTKELEISIFWDELLELAKYCISGDSILTPAGTNKYDHQCTVKELYEMINATSEELEKMPHHKKVRRRNMLKKKAEKGWYFKTWSMDDDKRLRPNGVTDLVYKGVQPIFRLKLKNGFTIDCTADHEIYTYDGIKKLKDLRPWDLVICKAGYENTDGKVFNENDFKQIFSKNLPRKGEKGFQKTNSHKEENYRKYSKRCRMFEASCDICGKEYSEKERFELHHIDGDHSNDRVENFLWLCNSCHKKEDYKRGRRKRGEKGLLTRPVEIESITFLKEDEVYDFTVESPSHNALVNDEIIISNCFNGSHSICYSTIGYQTAYLLTHYPEEYLAAYLNAKKDDKDTIAEVLGFCKEKGIKISTPDIEHPGLGFVPTKGKIAYGLTAIKGVGMPAERIVEKYNKDGAAKSLEEFLTSMEKKVLNTRVITALTYSGALDSLVPKEITEKETGFKEFAPRVILARNLEKIIKYRDDYLKTEQKRSKVKVSEEQASLLDYLFSGENELSDKEQKKKDSLTYPALELETSDKTLTPQEKKRTLISLLLKEKEYIGSFISYNPLNLLSQPNPDWYKDFEAASKRIREAGDQKLPYRDKVVKGIVGYLVKVRQIQTKKGQPMAFLEMELQDSSDKLHPRMIPMELTVFSENYSKIKRGIKEKFFYEMSVMPEQKEDGSGMVRAVATDIEAKDI